MLPEQNLPWWRHDRPWGFRFSPMDAAIVAGGGVLTWLAWPWYGLFSLCVPFLVLHFFLFCNTFQIGGERSLIWIAALLVNVSLWTQTQATVFHLIAQAVVTIALIGNCLWSMNYHGLWCETINPDGYLDGAFTEGAFTRRMLIRCQVPQSWIELLTGRRLREFEKEVPTDE